MVNNLENLKNLKKVKSFDIEEFDGVKSKVKEVILTDVEIKNFGSGDQKVQQLIIKSENLGDNEEKPIQAIEYISLKYDSETEQFGIPENAKSKAMKFLNYFKVESFDEVIGKECMIVKRVKENGSEFLGIHYG